MAEQEADVTNFSTSSSHRLPTVSANQALEAAARKSKRTPIGLSGLDDILRVDNDACNLGGIPRGQVTEIYGPPGVGKTALALQIAINAVQSFGDQSSVIWVNTGSAVPPSRVEAFVAGYRHPHGHEPPSSPPTARPKTDVLAKFDFINALTLPRLLTLFLHHTAVFPPPQAAMVVVDDFSNLVHGSFPKGKGRVATATAISTREKQAQKAAGRKWAVLADLATAMSRMAVVHHVAIVVINQTATILTKGEKAKLRPALVSPPWNSAVQNRILVYRDFVSAENAEGQPPSIAHQMRFAEIVKVNGKERDYGDNPITFVIRKGGIREVSLKNKLTSTTPAAPPPELNGPTKRKAYEISDSEEEGDEVGSGDDLGLPVEDDDSDVEILGDNKKRPPVVMTSQQLAYENGDKNNTHQPTTNMSLPVRASPRKSQVLLKGSEDYLTQVDEDGDDEEEPPDELRG
jgi:RecA/RadA recombinase